MAILRDVLFDMDIVTSTVNRIHTKYVREERPKSYSPPRNYYPPARSDSNDIYAG